jgi:hypothetical protein
MAQGQDSHPTVGYGLSGRSLPCILLFATKLADEISKCLNRLFWLFAGDEGKKNDERCANARESAEQGKPVGRE